MFSKYQWYWDRLRVMSLAEIVDRGELYIKKKKWKNQTSWLSPEPQLNHQDKWLCSIASLQGSAEYKALLAEANQYLEGKYTLLNIYFEEPIINWHLDPETGKQAPLGFGLDINYRDLDLVGNVKNIWEKSRHHHLTILALAYALTGEEKYAKAVEEQLNSWVQANPFPQGVNWTSSLEFGVRLISWIWLERLLRPSQSYAQIFGESGFLWPLIYRHQWMIAQHYSSGSSANNHLIGEMAGLFMAALVWPVFPESNDWEALARKILEREVLNQTFSSGLNREQAFCYHIFSLEFFLLAGIEGDRALVPFSTTYKNLVRKMLEVMPALLDVGGNLPQYGDGDNGMAVQLRAINSSRVDWLLRLGHQCFDAQVPLPSGDVGLLAATLIGLDTQARATNSSCFYGSVGFKDAGIFVLASSRGEPDEVFCLADAGSLGFLSIAAHGHADALAFTLSVGGVPIIVDPGTYVYHADPVSRSYFRGTKAHNTVTLDDIDQSEPAGTFLWTKKAETKILSWEEKIDGGILLAEHDGYERLSAGVTHRRYLELADKKLEIRDDLQGTGKHGIEWRLHFAPTCVVHLQEQCCIVSWHKGHLTIHLDPQMQWSLRKGEADGGWYSAGFNLKEATYTLVGSVNAFAPVFFKTYLEVFCEN